MLVKHMRKPRPESGVCNGRMPRRDLRKSTHFLLATLVAGALYRGIAARRRRRPCITVAIFVVVAGCGALESSGMCAIGTLERMRQSL
jgi:hypothetical protein